MYFLAVAAICSAVVLAYLYVAADLTGASAPTWESSVPVRFAWAALAITVIPLVVLAIQALSLSLSEKTGAERVRASMTASEFERAEQRRNL